MSSLFVCLISCPFKLAATCSISQRKPPFVLTRNQPATMSKPFDYSKWDKIELSDDEDDCHPNIDKESWFRMKHRSRVEREENEEKDKTNIKKEVSIVKNFS